MRLLPNKALQLTGLPLLPIDRGTLGGVETKAFQATACGEPGN